MDDWDWVAKYAGRCPHGIPSGWACQRCRMDIRRENAERMQRADDAELTKAVTEAWDRLKQRSSKGDGNP